MHRSAYLLLLIPIPLLADDATDALAKELRDYATAELAKVPGKDGKFSTVLSDSLHERIVHANMRDREAWAKIQTRTDWEAFRDERVKALRDSLGTWPEVPKAVPVRVTRTIEAGGYSIDNLLYESRPGVWVAGNLYRPSVKRDKMPVFLIAHSHHAPKHEGELQDMGVTWAKLGCMVLVIDQLGHGERRQHPFADAKSYPKEFRVGRQDYFFRYNLGLQLSLVGDSLMGWMAWDLMRGLDVVLARPGADKERVILLGSVAGGGDVAAVTAALDDRFKCVVPFNFGGPQPETRYPLPADAEETFDYVGGGSWESTRNLRDSARLGFPPWAIVASVAPRKVIHAHEFAWDRDRDPVWKRYQKVWGFYDATDGLAFTHGTGVIRGNDPTASHCNNIGPVHRKGIYAALKKWFDIPIPETESKERRPASELKCWTPDAERELKSRPLHEVLGEMADRQRARFVKDYAEAEDRDEFARTLFREPFNVVSARGPGYRGVDPGPPFKTCQARWLSTVTWAAHGLPPLVLMPLPRPGRKTTMGVCCISQDGIHTLLKERADVFARLLQSGVGVVIPNFPGTGIRRPGDGRGRTSRATELSSLAEVVNTPLIRARYVDAYQAFQDVLGTGDVEWDRVVFWGESSSPPVRPADEIAIPHDLRQPSPAEPLGATLATVLAASADFPKVVRGVVARGGLVSFRSVLDSPFVHVPHDALPVDMFSAGDLPDRWAHLAPKPLRLEGLVDGTNRRVTGAKLDAALKPVREKYAKGGLDVKEDYSSDAELAKWIIEQLKR
jgi:hypothetical protein